MPDKKELAKDMPPYQTAIEERVAKARSRKYPCKCGGTIVWEPERRMFTCPACGYVDGARSWAAKYGKGV